MIQGQIKENILSSCQKIENFDFNTLIPHLANLPNYTLEEFVAATKRCVKQLKEELLKGIGDYLPSQYNFNNEYGSGNLESDLNNFISFIEASSINLSAAVQCLNRLVYYQIDNGFWDRSTRKIHSHQDINARQLNDKILMLEEIVKSKLEEVTTEKQRLIDFLSQKTSELQQIERNLQTANTNTNQIVQFLTDSTQNNEKINSILTQQQDKLEESKKALEEQKKDFLLLKTGLEERISWGDMSLDNSKKRNDEFNVILEFVKSKEEYFVNRNTYLDNLIGREVGTSLFETFKQRKSELQSSVKFWQWAVPISTVITIGWIFFLFKNLGGIDSIQRWEFLAVNTLKSLPAIFLLFFVINQYRKERNFQEEYAFKSAVALTIMAYVGQINSPENKDKLIMDAVGRVYTSPIYQKTHKEEDSKSLIEELKTAKETIVDLVKSVKS